MACQLTPDTCEQCSPVPDHFWDPLTSSQRNQWHGTAQRALPHLKRRRCFQPEREEKRSAELLISRWRCLYFHQRNVAVVVVVFGGALKSSSASCTQCQRSRLQPSTNHTMVFTWQTCGWIAECDPHCLSAASTVMKDLISLMLPVFHLGNRQEKSILSICKLFCRNPAWKNIPSCSLQFGSPHCSLVHLILKAFSGDDCSPLCCMSVGVLHCFFLPPLLRTLCCGAFEILTLPPQIVST